MVWPMVPDQHRRDNGRASRSAWVVGGCPLVYEALRADLDKAAALLRRHPGDFNLVLAALERLATLRGGSWLLEEALRLGPDTGRGLEDVRRAFPRWAGQSPLANGETAAHGRRRRGRPRTSRRWDRDLAIAAAESAKDRPDAWEIRLVMANLAAVMAVEKREGTLLSVLAGIPLMSDDLAHAMIGLGVIKPLPLAEIIHPDLLESLFQRDHQLPIEALNALALRGDLTGSSYGGIWKAAWRLMEGGQRSLHWLSRRGAKNTAIGRISARGQTEAVILALAANPAVPPAVRSDMAEKSSAMPMATIVLYALAASASNKDEKARLMREARDAAPGQRLAIDIGETVRCLAAAGAGDELLAILARRLPLKRGERLALASSPRAGAKTLFALARDRSKLVSDAARGALRRKAPTALWVIEKREDGWANQMRDKRRRRRPGVNPPVSPGKS